ncbi:MAG: RpiB/LacA/LacB family sugar-phosphate isomerase [Spirochaetales bacterium]|nr:RpiB/LacA/LacB family sugar-phosphate isomerase [Spirochaetales bacterium]
MKIAVINETSAADKNGAILEALEGRGHEIINAGMTKSGMSPELTYIHTGFLTALLLNTGRADMVVGGCGTGQGYLNSCMQYPGVFCGHILTSLDAWLFTQINGGNCLALALNQGYGWAADVNLTFIFDRLFSVERGIGYPAHRKESQAQSRRTLTEISRLAHRSFPEIIDTLPEEILTPCLSYPGIGELVQVDTLKDPALKAALQKRMN